MANESGAYGEIGVNKEDSAMADAVITSDCITVRGRRLQWFGHVEEIYLGDWVSD